MIDWANAIEIESHSRIGLFSDKIITTASFSQHKKYTEIHHIENTQLTISYQ